MKDKIVIVAAHGFDISAQISKLPIDNEVVIISPEEAKEQGIKTTFNDIAQPSPIQIINEHVPIFESLPETRAQRRKRERDLKKLKKRYQ
jgi:hypothetical protein